MDRNFDKKQINKTNIGTTGKSEFTSITVKLDKTFLGKKL